MPYLSTHPRRGFRYGDIVAHVGINSSLRGQRGRVVRVYTHNNDVKVDIQWEQRKEVLTYSQIWACMHIGISLSSLVSDDHRFDCRRYVAKYAEFSKSLEWINRKPHDRSLMTHAEMKKAVAGRTAEDMRDDEPVTDGMLYRLGLLMGTKPVFPCRIMRDTDKAVFDVPSLKELSRLPHGMYTILNAEGLKPAPKLDTKTAPEFPYYVRNATTGVMTLISTQGELETLDDGDYEVLAKVNDLSIKPVEKSTISFS